MDILIYSLSSSTKGCPMEDTVGASWSYLLLLGPLLEHITMGLLLPSAIH